MFTPFDNSWEALLIPGKATHYFNLKYPDIELQTKNYSAVNALWLAELSRLIYRQHSDELGKPLKGPTRHDILASVHLRETVFINQGDTQCALVETLANVANPFAVLVFRGTHNVQKWFYNLQALPVEWEGGRVHKGFKDALEVVWDEITVHLARLKIPIFYTGHSLGAALATLAASRKPPHALYTFGSPRVGDSQFAKGFNAIQAYRIVNHCDVVTTVPPIEVLDFCHVGELHYISYENQMLVNPTEATIVMDRYKRMLSVADLTDYQKWLEPIEMLADHNPVNYVAHLERFL